MASRVLQREPLNLPIIDRGGLNHIPVLGLDQIGLPNDYARMSNRLALDRGGTA